MKPNIVLINCDDLGYGDIGCYGSTKNDTPYIDRLAAEGRRFTDFYMASPVCSPSRAGMMTGCYPPRIGFGLPKRRVLFPADPIGLAPSETTIADVLKSAGYRTLHVGKWHCGDQQPFLPTSHGFDDYYGLPYSNDMCPTRTVSYPPLPLMHGDEVIEEQPDQRGLTERYTEKCVEFIRDCKETPFFLYLGHMHVHVPLYAAETFVKRSRNGDYGACVMAVDWSTGAIVDALKRYSVYENTIVIFTSDNGSRNDFGESNGNLKGTKTQTWEGGQRVPFVIHWAGHIAPSVSHELVTSMDFLPSFAKLAGAELPDDLRIDGIDLSDLMLGKTEKSDRDTFFYYLEDALEAARVGDWKLHVAKPRGHIDAADFDSIAPGLSEGVRKELIPVRALYNLKEDPGEKVNLYSEYPEIVSMITKKIEACRADIGDTFTGTVGKNNRPIGRVEHPVPLTEYDENHPYIISLYDKEEKG